MTAGNAWYTANRNSFLAADTAAIVGQLAHEAGRRGWHVEQEQHEEWATSVSQLQDQLPGQVRRELDMLREALADADGAAFTDVVLEYDFRRRGLRLDCVLLGPGVIVVIEFKRTKLTAADRDQVTNYCINLVEFHEETRDLCKQHEVIVVPILALTEGRLPDAQPTSLRFHNPPWSAVFRAPIECDAKGLGKALSQAARLRIGYEPVSPQRWLASKFSPSSTILDAAISLYGQHDVSAIDEHAAPVEHIRACTSEVARHIQEAKKVRRNRIVFVSGAPGAGKTLVGLKLAFDPNLREDAVFVTGNAPLVDVLSEALKQSYKRASNTRAVHVPTGYAQEDIYHVIQNATFKIVKAHHFLGDRGKHTASSDGSVVIFDEAQRTYEKGRMVINTPLEDHEADLILASLEGSYEDGAVVVALLGQNQAINRGERGAIAWLEAAERRGWDFAICNETLALPEFAETPRWGDHALRHDMAMGHLSHSMRFYRNRGVEEWAHALLEGEVQEAQALAKRLEAEGHTVWVTRNLAAAKQWARAHRVGAERSGMVASGQGRRLIAEGIFVDQKPPIAKWMLAPSGDIRSSNMLETVQNQFHIQGLELDYTIVCWDADLRREATDWAAYKISGAAWQRDRAVDVAKNGYRVLLTRARKGMILFVPKGDREGLDETRAPEFYSDIADYLQLCGAQPIQDEAESRTGSAPKSTGPVSH